VAGVRETTERGYNTWECVSALQKSIRRGLEEEAMYWFLELAESGLYYLAANRVRITSQEDVGLAAPEAVEFANRALDLADKWWKGKNDAWMIGAGNAIMALSRSKKSRIGDHFYAAVKGRMQSDEIKMPDWALDKHTQRGRKMGRSWKHFQEVGTVLENKQKIEGDDGYEIRAFAYWDQPKDKKKGGELF